jgi:Xaa-Pro aminopeptidase
MLIREALSSAECDWLNGYHAELQDLLAPRLSEPARRWLAQAAAAI